VDTHRRCHAIVLLAAAITLGVANPAYADPAGVELPFAPGSTEDIATDINDGNIVVGYSSNTRVAIRWAPDGTPTTLPRLPVLP
jgi:hypothetical protein